MATQKSRLIDFYRKIPTDLTEATSLGGLLSIFAAVFMTLLLVVELMSFLSHTTETMVVLDPGLEEQIRINFNITLLDLPCRYAVVDVLDVLGTNRMNVSRNIEKWSLDQDGRRRFFQGRNREERDIEHDEHHPELQVLLQNGEHALPLDTNNFDEYLKTHDYTFVNFYAPWCVWCQRLHPTWEAFAEEVEKDELPIKITKVDCSANEILCREQRVHAFPTLRLFRGNKPLPPDYNSDRTTVALKSYVSRKINVVEKHKGIEDLTEYKEYPGCMLVGHLQVNRVPGNFHLEARSKVHNLNAAMTNLSHVVNSLSFGPPVAPDAIKRLERFSSEFYVANSLDGTVLVLEELHRAYHHYLKVVPTLYELPGSWGKNVLVTYQMLSESSVMSYAVDEVPEARFNYDISPMSVVVKKTGRRWYEFVTTLCAITGGTYQVMGLIDHVLHRLLKADKGL